MTKRIAKKRIATKWIATGPIAKKGRLDRWRFLLTLLALSMVALTIVAPGGHAQRRLPTALQLAEKVDRHYNVLKSLRVEFTQQYDGMGMHKHDSGTLLLKKPGRMRWTYSTPAGKLFVLDGKFAYFYAPGDSQVQRVPAKQLDDLRSPLRFLLGRTQLAKELSDLTATPREDGFLLSGTPRGMEKRVSSLSLLVTAEGSIRSMKIEEVDGAVTAFTFSGEQPNAPASDGSFVFNAPAGVPVVAGLPPV